MAQARLDVKVTGDASGDDLRENLPPSTNRPSVSRYMRDQSLGQ